MEAVSGMKAYRIIYISTASLVFSQQNLIDLLTQSRGYNSKNDVTGLLLYASGHFMQLLEGAQDELESLLSRIKKDSRHRDITVLEEGTTRSHDFSDWSMAFLDFHSPQIRALVGYSAFLEGPPLDAETINQHHLLQYFKAVMTASSSSILKLSGNVADQSLRSTS